MMFDEFKDNALFLNISVTSKTLLSKLAGSFKFESSKILDSAISETTFSNVLEAYILSFALFNSSLWKN